MRQRLRQRFVEDPNTCKARIKESNLIVRPEKKERYINFEQPLRDRGCHKPRSPTEIFYIGLVALLDRVQVAKPKPPASIGVVWITMSQKFVLLRLKQMPVQLLFLCRYQQIKRSSFSDLSPIYSWVFPQSSQIRHTILQVNLSFFGALLY